MRAKIFSTLSLPAGVNAALLFLRIVFGLAFAMHGWGKIQHPTSWMGPDAAIPPVLQALAAVAEFAGGIFIILGLLTRIAAAGLICTMLVAVYLHAIIMHDPFVSATHGSSYELALVFLSISVLLFAIGAGCYSVDYLLSGKKN